MNENVNNNILNTYLMSLPSQEVFKTFKRHEYRVNRKFRK